MIKVFIISGVLILGIIIALLWPKAEENDSDILLAVLMTKSYSIPGNIPWKNFMVCDIRDRNQCLKNARFQNPRHVLMVDLDNYNIEKKHFIRNKLDPHTLYYVSVTSGIYTWNAPILLPQEALERCKYNGKILECPPEIPKEFTDAYMVQDYSKIESDMEYYDKNKHFIHLGRAYEQLNETEEALTWYEKELEHGISVPEHFYALYRIAVLKLLHHNNGTHDDFYGAYLYNPFRKEPLYYLARLARSNEKYSTCLLYTHAALNMGEPSMDEWYVEYNIYNWAIEDQHAECLYYLGQKKQAKWYWNKLLERNDFPNEQTRNRIEKNLAFTEK